MKRLPASTHHFVMPLILSGGMTVIVSGISIIRAIGFQGLSSHWLGAWLWSWVIAYPALLIVLPLVRRLMHHIVDEPLNS